MPAQFSFYIKIADTKTDPIILYESPDKNYISYKREIPLYNSDSLETAKVIGIETVIYTNIINVSGSINSSKTFIKFNEVSELPYGDNNILVHTRTGYDDNKNTILVDGVYLFIVSQNESTGEYANQVGYIEYVKDSTKILAKETCYFPQPILTYTNAFNSLPQPSTAPLPA